MNVALVTWAGLPELSADDQLLRSALAERGAAVRALAWDDPQACWSRFDRVVLRSCWDYHLRLEEFLAWLDEREREGVALWNPASLVRRNLHKSYLLELAQAGLPVVPTVCLRRGATVTLAALLAAQGWTDAVVKPAVSASAFETWRVSRARAEAAGESRRFAALLAERDLLVQPFVPEVLEHGEWSLHFFAGRYSHAVLKRAPAGDFRVQGDCGGTASAAVPAPRLRRQAARVLATLAMPWLYARVDGVQCGGRFVLMELELIEPALHLARAAHAPGMLADAVLGAPPAQH